MNEIFTLADMIELAPEGLVIVSQLEPTTEVTTITVYEREPFFINPNPTINHNQLAKFSVCHSCYNQTIVEIQDMFRGWSKIDRTNSIELIGIHNQDPQTLYIQFSLDQRYFIYERCLGLNYETVSEELFGKKHYYRLRALNSDDEHYLITNLRFLPKTRRELIAYPQRTRANLSHARNHLYLPCSC